jgi:hypothetical protein
MTTDQTMISRYAKTVAWTYQAAIELLLDSGKYGVNLIIDGICARKGNASPESELLPSSDSERKLCSLSIVSAASKRVAVRGRQYQGRKPDYNEA